METELDKEKMGKQGKKEKVNKKVEEKVGREKKEAGERMEE